MLLSFKASMVPSAESVVATDRSCGGTGVDHPHGAAPGHQEPTSHRAEPCTGGLRGYAAGNDHRVQLHRFRYAFSPRELHELIRATGSF